MSDSTLMQSTTKKTETKLLVSIGEAAQLLAISQSSVRRLIQRRFLVPVKICRHIRIPLTQVQALAEPKR